MRLKAQKRIKKIEQKKSISESKVTQFKNDFLSEYNRLADVNKIFKHYNLYENNTDGIYENELERGGIKKIDHKAAFFDEWHIAYVDWGKGYGKNMAIIENENVFSQLSQNCHPAVLNEFHSILNSFSEISEIIILSTYGSLYKTLMKSENFRPSWQKEDKFSTISRYAGSYLFKKYPIPLFELPMRRMGREILVLNKSHLGKWLQYSPLSDEKEEEYRFDKFYIEVCPITEKRDLMDEYIRNREQWPNDVQNEEEMEAYLKTLALVNIYERFKIQISEEFKGFRIRVEGK